SHPLISEILYDAAGDDTGREFVELLNPSAKTFALAGARLEMGDGSGPGRWTARWTGAPGDSIAPGGRFVIGGALIGITPDALDTLARGRAPRDLAPGDTASVNALVSGLAPGKRRLVVEAALEGDEAPENDRDSLWVRIGRGPLQLTEVQFHPASDEGEWVE